MTWEFELCSNMSYTDYALKIKNYMYISEDGLNSLDGYIYQADLKRNGNLITGTSENLLYFMMDLRNDYDILIG